MSLGAPPEAVGMFAHRVKRRCHAIAGSDAFFKTSVIGGGFLSATLAMMASLSAA
jgi:hypothetical protein